MRPQSILGAFWACLLLLVTMIPAMAEVPLQISYQGMLTDDTGLPVPDDSYAMTLGIYDVVSGGTALWIETQTVSVTDGVYNVVLGQPGNEIDPADMDGDRYLGVTVGSDDEMTPRQPITATAFSLRAAVADDAETLDGMDAADFADSDHSHAFIELTGTATDAQIPNTITVNYAASAGDADTLDGFNSGAFAQAAHDHSAIQIVSGTLSTSRFSAYSDLYSEGYLANASGDIAQNNSTQQVNLNADLLDGFHAGAFAQAAHDHSATQIVSGTLSTSRFSAYSDLYSEGYLANASGDIAQNNGSRQVNLNADLLDGQHASIFVNTSATAQTKYGELTLDASAINLSTGIRALGTNQAGFFQSSDGSGYANLGYSNSGIRGVGNYQGGIFIDQNDSGIAYVGYGNRGIWAKGTMAGGTFSHPDNTTYWADVSTSTHKILGTGTVSFVQNHPYDENTVIVYAAPEGDEVAVYTRGSARLVDGEARVSLGETFQYVANPDIGLTAHLTPRSDNAVVYVASVSTSELVVRSVAGFSDDAAFDYLVYGLRLGFEEAAVLQPKQRDALIPTAEAIEDGYGDRPDLRTFNALERYREMHAAVSPGAAFDLSQTRELVSALEDQRSAALAREAARQEGMPGNSESTDGDNSRTAANEPIAQAGTEKNTGGSLPVQALIAELRAEIDVLKDEIAAIKSVK